MPATIGDGANHITTKGHAFGMFQHKRQCINALKTRQKNRPFGVKISYFHLSNCRYHSKHVFGSMLRIL